eukprot:sb/3462255/
MGPKVIMIKKMMIDLVLFLFLIFIFLLTYGVCSQALKDPTSLNFDGGRLCLLPALNIFGEIGLEDLEADVLTGHCVVPQDMTVNETCVSTYEDNFLDFVNEHSVVLIHYYILQALMFAYLVFVNVLLLNLLIAIFSNTYESINSEASKIWKVQWCFVVKEFEQRQPLPSPLSLVYYIFQGTRWICNVEHIKCLLYRAPCSCCGRFKSTPPKPVSELDDYQLLMLIADARVEYSNELEENEQNDTPKSLRFIKDKLISLDHRMSEMERRGYSGGAGGGGGEQLPKLGENSERSSQVYSILQGEHKDSRKTPYIGSDVQRYRVNDRYVSWDVAFPEEESYNPPNFTTTTVLDIANKLEADPSDPRDILGEFNDVKQVGEIMIDRTSFIQKYQVKNGYPRNPKGRTGLRGRGQLLRWGPNPTAEPIITRWARDNTGALIKLNGLPVLEFVGVFLREAECWSIPGGPIRHGEHLTEALKREFSEDALGGLTANEEETKSIMNMLREHLEGFDLHTQFSSSLCQANALTTVLTCSANALTSDNIIMLFLHSVNIEICFIQKYQVKNGYPRNPKGRTGLRGRGQLLRWGPNPGGEPIITRWARDNTGALLNRPVIIALCSRMESGKNRPNQEILVLNWLITSHDALGGLTANEEETKSIMNMLREHLELGIAVRVDILHYCKYSQCSDHSSPYLREMRIGSDLGYVDDPRNTDNAWVESSAINYHDSLGTSFSKFPLRAQDVGAGETIAAEWIALSKNINLYGNHEWILEKLGIGRVRGRYLGDIIHDHG